MDARRGAMDRSRGFSLLEVLLVIVGIALAGPVLARSRGMR